MNSNAHRVIVWGVGVIGAEMASTILDYRPDLELVGAKVYSSAKDGVDVGELIGRDPIGVAATTDAERLIELDADCVIYTPRVGDIDEVCRLLASGKNVATTVFLFYPPALPPADHSRLSAACTAGGTSLHASGINPGNLSSALPLVLSGMSRVIDKITLQERADMTLYESTDISFGNMAFGEPLERISVDDGGFLTAMNSMFTEQVWQLAAALNAGIDEVVATVEAVPAKADHQVFDRLLAAGTTAGQRWNWSGRRDGVARVEIETLWTVGGEYPTHWPAPEHGWTLTIEGEPSMRTHFLSLASFTRSATIAEHVHAGNVATAMQVLNAVPALCRASTGFVSPIQLGLVTSGVGFRQ
ncbi:dihydrodipicolinate reductase [Mycolicibacterium farcinogenes]|uniref:NAD(P)H-dependent amine dehydrogenase family protein n=1 Tax=Mycolicibacterium farcinogenes TaxID=1802 RepID=UPI001C8CF914|nr:dihydrodipicolinate reductase [Mycolicibacterium farcinogenes]QZH58424.1 dihydrodipicolinate reductase [Mycolicibacterium farcinogenes]